MVSERSGEQFCKRSSGMEYADDFVRGEVERAFKGQKSYCVDRVFGESSSGIVCRLWCSLLKAGVGGVPPRTLTFSQYL